MMKRTWQGRIDPGVFVSLLSFSFHQWPSSKNEFGEYAFDLEHLLQKELLMACLSAHSAISKSPDRHWKYMLYYIEKCREREALY